MSDYFMAEEDHPILSERSIIKQDDVGVLLTYYIRYATKNQLDFNHLLPNLLEQL